MKNWRGKDAAPLPESGMEYRTMTWETSRRQLAALLNGESRTENRRPDPTVPFFWSLLAAISGTCRLQFLEPAGGHFWNMLAAIFGICRP